MPRKFKTKSIIIFLLLILVYSLLYSTIYNYLVMGKIDEFDVKFKNVCGQLTVELPHKDTYLIKIWGLYYPKKVYFNKTEVVPFWTRERGELKEIFIRARDVDKGINLLNIISDQSYSVRVKNFFGATESRGIFILFNTSRFLKSNPGTFIVIAVWTYIFLIFFWLIFYFITQIIFLNFNLTKFFLLFWVYNIGLSLLFLIFIFFSSFASYRIIFSGPVFVSVSISLLFLTTLVILLYPFIFKHSRQLMLTNNASYLMSLLTNKSFDQHKHLPLYLFISELKLHFRKYPAQYLISTFLALLFLCMIMLIFKLYGLANWISYMAYFCLATGLGIQFVKLIKENR